MFFPNALARCCGNLLIVATAFLTGCTTLDPAHSGQIAGSIGQLMTVRDSYSKSWLLDYRSLDKKHRGSLVSTDNQWPFGSLMNDIKEGEYRGTTFLKTVPAGEYAFLKPSNRDFADMLMGREEVELARFTVRPGKVTYVGSWVAIPVKGRNLLGLETSVGFTVATQNREARDMAIIARKNPGLLPAGNTATTGPAVRPARSVPPPVSSGGTKYLTPTR